MGRKAAATVKTTTDADGDMSQAIRVFAARQQFMSYVLSMGWQLLFVVLIPIIAGVKLDEKFNTSPSITLTGFFVATAAAVMVVSKMVKEVNKIQAEEDKENKSSDS